MSTLSHFNAKLIDETKKATCCDANLAGIKDWLSSQLNDELDAYHHYENIAQMLDHFYPEFAPRLREMAEEEFEHYLSLVSIVSIINEECKCS